MKAAKIRLYKHTTPFNFGFRSPHTHRTTPEAVIFEIVFDNGISGIGESIPRTYVTGEDCESVIRTVEHHFSTHLFQMEIINRENVDQALAHLEQVAQDNLISSYQSALGGIDIALLDALGQLENKPLYRYMGNLTESHVNYSISVPLLPPEQIRKYHQKVGNLKFGHVKIILGNDPEENLTRFELIQSLFDPDIKISLEANGRYTQAEIEKNLNLFRGFSIHSFEQPAPKQDFDGLRRVREKYGIPVIADESLCSKEDALVLIENEACDGFNVKLSKCGGLIRSREIVSLARQHNKSWQLGSHVGETEILARAGGHFAAANGDLAFAEIGSSILLNETSKLLSPMSMIKDHVDRPGLGWHPAEAELVHRFGMPVEMITSH